VWHASFREKPRGKIPEGKMVPNFNDPGCNVFFPLEEAFSPVKKNQNILPQNLTWNLKMMVSKRNLLFQGLLFRFHVKFQGCTSVGDVGSCASTSSTELWSEPLESGSSTSEVY